jgi:lipopolysaccharide biosynthesis glycosyltransferase
MIPQILNGERFLYLDADIVAQIDLDEIWRNYRADMLVGGVPDMAAQYWQRRLGFTEPDLYLNSGVLLINGQAWRDERALERCAVWLQANPQRLLADQDTLNSALLGSLYAIPDHWNVLAVNQPQGWRLDPDSFRGIYHFAGPVKPWMRWADPVLQEFYLHYARVVGLPASYWVEARNAREALAEAHWAERLGNLAKASTIHKRVAEAALARLKEVSPDAVVDLR